MTKQWRLINYINGCNIVSDKDEVICEIPFYSKQDAIDAQLIASAPDLLNWLCNAREQLNRFKTDRKLFESTIDTVIYDIDQMILVANKEITIKTK